MSNTYTLLQKITVGANASSITFNNIPQSYTDLVLVSTTRMTGGIQAIDVRLNGDTGANYSWIYLQGTGSGVDANKTPSATIFGEAMVTSGNASPANAYSNSTLYIPNYTSNTVKSFTMDSVEEENGTNAYMRFESGIWNNTAAISSITISGSGDIVQYSTFYLYGVAKLGVTPTSAPKATGGDIITEDANYYYHAFRSSGTFTPKSSLSCDVLIVAGGGGATNGNGEGSGGGGAGGVCYQAARSVTASTAYTVTIGAGGTGAVINSGQPTQGGNSVFDTITANGGGASRSEALSPTSLRNGGSGGGGGGNFATAGTATQTDSGGATGYGTNGGAGYNSNPYTGGGGGGAGAAGSAASSTAGGAGGAGKNDWSSWATATGTGVSGYYAGGGAGGNLNGSGAAATGGSGGGGSGGKYAGGAVVTQPTAGTINTGGGAGGGANQTEFKNGGSGIVIVRYAK